MPYTYSGHRNCPGMQGLRIDMGLYKKVDAIHGPSSWTVEWTVKDGKLYADNSEVGGLDTLLTRNQTVREILLSKENIVANIGENYYRKSFFVDYRSAKEKGFLALSSYMREFEITLKYEDERDVHGPHCIILKKGDASYESHFDWPYTQSKEVEEIFSSLRKLVDPKKMQLIVAPQ